MENKEVTNQFLPNNYRFSIIAPNCSEENCVFYQFFHRVMDVKTIISRFFAFILFASCFLFVAYRGYECLEKFLNKTQATDITYQSSEVLNFPSVTFCPKVDNMLKLSAFPKPFKVEELAKCNLTWQQYAHDGHWIGEGEA